MNSPPPQHVGDVQAAAADLRVAGRLQVGAQPEDRRHRADQQRLLVGGGVDPADGAEARPDGAQRGGQAGPVGQAATRGGRLQPHHGGPGC
jgi:hypothetical protein